MHFSIDTGAQFSVLPKPSGQATPTSTIKLLAANGTRISTYGSKSVMLDLILGRRYTWKLLVADVGFSVICMDFLQHYCFSIDMQHQKICDPTTQRCVTSISTPSSETDSYVETLRDCIRSLRLTPPGQNTQKQVYIDKALDEATHVYVRRMAPGSPLERPYDGPYRVLRRSSKFLTFGHQGVWHTVSIDRLKPAHIDEDTDVPGHPWWCAKVVITVGGVYKF
ncbi:hypothetical protein Hamer_G000085 [Homarus americanus]|uniref:Peptidase A2 domain-containing protein n=1 Tax=Homarus americanus TaxID=6706 RepID=A0A8J5NC79_HOMAM|nr:hypothetical protein Hamer_G000085 [Homarus americanus]